MNNKSSRLNLSLGSKLMSKISFIIVIVASIIGLFLFKLSLGVFLILSSINLIYSMQVRFINYIYLDQQQFVIENVFRSSSVKPAPLFIKVIEVLPFAQIMKISFKDGSYFFFFGKSEVTLNRQIDEALKGNSDGGII